jgi:hypothetical protein
MTLIAALIVYLLLLGIAILTGRFLKECDASMMSSSDVSRPNRQ